MKLRWISCYSLAITAGLSASTVSSLAQSAMATISGVSAGGGSYDYTITLQNTSSYSLNSFWYGWTTDGNNLPSNPTVAGNSLGWDNDLTGNSIIWQNTSGVPLLPGQSGTFTFSSPDSPSAIAAPPSGESVAYVGEVDGSQAAPGDSTDVFSPVPSVSTPEPAALDLIAAGSIGLLGSLRRRLRAPMNSAKH